MIDVKDLSENPDKFRASQRARGADESVVDAIIAADSARRAALIRYENLRAEQNVFGKKVAQAKGDEKKALLAEVKELANTVKAASAEADAVQIKQDELLRAIPNLIEDGVPEGGEDDYVVVKTVGKPREFADFEPKDHLEIGELIGAIDMERGAKVSGSRFYFLRGMGARLELALMRLALDHALTAGFVPLITPTLVRPEIMRGTGFLGEHSDEIYYLPADDLYLTGTSEVALAGYHSDEILDLTELETQVRDPEARRCAPSRLGERAERVRIEPALRDRAAGGVPEAFRERARMTDQHLRTDGTAGPIDHDPRRSPAVRALHDAPRRGLQEARRRRFGNEPVPGRVVHAKLGGVAHRRIRRATAASTRPTRYRHGRATHS